MAFGTGVMKLPVPELLPFRLTPQFIHLCEPLNGTNLMQLSMIIVLNSLVQNKDLLLNCLGKRKRERERENQHTHTH